MFVETIEKLGTVNVARACGVSKGLVSIWKRNGTLPYKRGGKRVAHYERVIARMAGMSLNEFREQMKAEQEHAA